MDDYNLRLIKALFNRDTIIHRKALKILRSLSSSSDAITMYVAMQQIPKQSMLEEEWMFEILGTLIKNPQALWRIWNARWPEVPMPEHVFGADHKIGQSDFYDREYLHMIIARFPKKDVYHRPYILQQLIQYGDFELARHFDRDYKFPVLWKSTDELRAMVRVREIDGLAHHPELIDLPLHSRWARSLPITLAQMTEATDFLYPDAMKNTYNFAYYGYAMIPDAEKQAFRDIYAERSKQPHFKMHPMPCHGGGWEHTQWRAVAEDTWRANEDLLMISDTPYGSHRSQRAQIIGDFIKTVRCGFTRPRTAALRAFANLCPDLMDTLYDRAFGSVGKKICTGRDFEFETAINVLTWTSKYLVPWPFPG